MPDTTPQPRLYMITGSRGAGKTKFCQEIARAARQAGLDVAGIVSVAVFEGIYRKEIIAEDLRTGESHLLATRRDTEAPLQPLATRNWQFDPQGLAWGSRVLADSVPVSVLIVDELGTLEFEREQGWLSGLEALDSQQYSLALVVIRPELLGSALQRWPNAYIVEIDTPEDSQDKARQLSKSWFR